MLLEHKHKADEAIVVLLEALKGKDIPWPLEAINLLTKYIESETP
jgi:hypothetical protein